MQRRRAAVSQPRRRASGVRRHRCRGSPQARRAWPRRGNAHHSAGRDQADSAQRTRGILQPRLRRARGRQLHAGARSAGGPGSPCRPARSLREVLSPRPRSASEPRPRCLPGCCGNGVPRAGLRPGRIRRADGAALLPDAAGLCDEGLPAAGDDAARRVQGAGVSGHGAALRHQPGPHSRGQGGHGQAAGAHERLDRRLRLKRRGRAQGLRGPGPSARTDPGAGGAGQVRQRPQRRAARHHRPGRGDRHGGQRASCRLHRCRGPVREKGRPAAAGSRVGRQRKPVLADPRNSRSGRA